MRELIDLMKFLKVECDALVEGIFIKDIVYDSRKTAPGALFICIAGHTVDGHDFAEQAQSMGAVAIVAEKPLPDSINIPVLYVQDTKVAMQRIVPFFFDYPASKMKMIGVTGTNGKTTTTNIIYNILKSAGHSVGMIGTIEVKYADVSIVSANTTPDVVDLQKLLYDMYCAGVGYVVMEVSSHALALERVAGCDFDIAVLTNITQDHLDFHKTFEAYRDAKGLLFSKIGHTSKKNTVAIVNVDDGSAEYIKGVSTATELVDYSLHSTAALRILNYSLHMDSMEISMDTPCGKLECCIATTGLFNIYNVLAAVGVAIKLGVDLNVIKNTLQEFQPVAGRFELVQVGQKFTVVVDYAHTPDGLENVLRTAREVTKGRLIVVFGCGGNRDATKRPLMAGIAEDIADVIFLTSDNPRKEDPQLILQEVEAGIKHRETTNYFVIADRKKAIERAMGFAQPQDLILIAGKGHETYQILHDRTIDFDDRVVAKEALKELGYVDK